MTRLPPDRGHARRTLARWMFVALATLALLGVLLAVTGDARAQSFDRLDAHTPPDIPGQGTPDDEFLSWLDENKWWLLFAITLGAALLIAYWLLNQDTRHKRLQRDGLEKLRLGLVSSCKATRGPAKSVWLTGSPRDPPCRLGRYRGHHRSVEAVWIAYATWLLGKTQLVAVNPVDLNGLDAHEIHVRAIAINQTRGLGFAVPDTHNATQRAEWAHSSPAPLATPVESAEAWKAYYARAVDNALAFYDAMNAAEDRSFLRQEVTRTPDELTETILAPAAPPAPEAKHDD